MKGDGILCCRIGIARLMPLFPLQTVRNNSPVAKPELWRSFPLALLRNVRCRFGANDVLRTVQLDGGARMTVDMRTGMGTSIYVYKCWEYPVTELLKAVLQPGMCFLDVGANIGYYSIVAAAYGAKVHAFEPVPKLFEALQENVAQNAHLNIFPHAMALARDTRPTTFFVVDDPANQGLSSLRESPEAVAITIQAHSLDDFVREQKLQRVDLMKVDVEGAEEQVFQGGTDILASDAAPDIIFECHLGATSDRILRAFGYRIYEFRGQRDYEARNLFASKRELLPQGSALLRRTDQ
jgi:FkbM family methyltransferase